MYIRCIHCVNFFISIFIMLKFVNVHNYYIHVRTTYVHVLKQVSYIAMMGN